MNIKKFIKRIICLGISSVLITSDSFAEQIITNLSKKPQKQLKNNITKSKLDSLLEKSKNLSSEQKKKILIYASKLSLKAFVTGSTILFINKLLNILFSTKLDEPKNQVKDNTDDPKNKDKSDQNIRDNYKNKSPFANLAGENNNCYIDATLQILYENPEFRKYVEDNANSKENHEKKYTYLSQIFKDMDEYKGRTVPYNQARKNFEKALEHNGTQQDPDFVVSKLVLDSDEVIHMYKYLNVSSGFDQFRQHEIKNSKTSILIDFCRAGGDGANYKDKKIQKYSYKFDFPDCFCGRKLKGLTVHQGIDGNSGHYVAYKADDQDRWWVLDDYGQKNEIAFNNTSEILSNDYIRSNVFFVYYQVVKNQ